MPIAEYCSLILPKHAWNDHRLAFKHLIFMWHREHTLSSDMFGNFLTNIAKKGVFKVIITIKSQIIVYPIEKVSIQFQLK